MNLDKLIKISDALHVIAKETGVRVEDIIDALYGVCWDEDKDGIIEPYGTEASTGDE